MTAPLGMDTLIRSAHASKMFETSKDAKAWLESRTLLRKVMREGTTLRSTGLWMAFDEGNGVAAPGVNTCVAIATPDMLAHVNALMGKEQLTNIKLLIEILRLKRIGVVELYSKNATQLMETIGKLFDESGIQTKKVVDNDPDTSFTIIVKDGKITHFTE